MVLRSHSRASWSSAIKIFLEMDRRHTLNVATTDSFWRVICLIAARCSSLVVVRSDFSRSNLKNKRSKWEVEGRGCRNNKYINWEEGKRAVRSNKYHTWGVGGSGEEERLRKKIRQGKADVIEIVSFFLAQWLRGMFKSTDWQTNDGAMMARCFLLLSWTYFPRSFSELRHLNTAL